jgi:hypothetical protein
VAALITRLDRFGLRRKFGIGLLCCTGLSLQASTENVSFRSDVMAVLSKAGCNMGTCHGNQNGKAGFKLSLRGEDPEADYRALTRDMFARRTNPNAPDQSLLLLKATAQLAHEGGQRFTKESPEYAMLQAWIAAEARDDAATAPKLLRLSVSPTEQILIEPSTEAQFTVTAEFADGTRRDVTRLACYETANQLVKVSEGRAQSVKPGETTMIVRYLNQQVPARLAFVPARPKFKWSGAQPHNFVDEHVFAKLKSLRMNPSAPCTDTEFVRRAYLDLLGMLPTSDEARAFINDRSRNKRQNLVDRLLERPEFADFWALKWADLLRTEEKVLDTKGVQAFHRWIRQSVAENKPVDEFVHEILTARGSTYENPAANYLRALRDPVTRAESTAQLFLGTRLQCARCHNHPFDRWTQNDYYDWADVFAPVQYKILDNRRRDGLDTHEFNGEQIVWASGKPEVKNPRTGKAAQARLLGSNGPIERGEAAEMNRLAKWLTDPTNKLFGQAQVNRVWYHLMGRGLVDPVDDFRPTNPASIPSLLEALAQDFVKHNYDLRHLIRSIMKSRVYQTSSEPNETNADDEANFARAIVRRLTAEQLLDAQNQVSGVPSRFNGYPEGIRAAQIPGARAVRLRERKLSDGDMFLKVFGKPERLLTCECERSTDTSMGQAFQLISGPGIHDLLSDEDNRIGKLLKAGASTEKIVDELYWSALSRSPTVAETSKCLSYVREAKDQRRALEDLTWALMNSKEFVLRK